MSDKIENTKIANGETDAAPGEVPALRFVTLPFVPKVERRDTKSARHFCGGFAAWVHAECVHAMLELRRLDWRAHEVNVSAIHAVERAAVPLKNGARQAFLSATGSDAEIMLDFFSFHIDRAEHEVTLKALDFWHQMTLDEVSERDFDSERLDWFEAAFHRFLAESRPVWRGQWRASGLSVDDLIAEIFSSAIEAE